MNFKDWEKKYIINFENSGKDIVEITSKDVALLNEFDEFMKSFELDIFVKKIEFKPMTYDGVATLSCSLDCFSEKGFLFFLHIDKPKPHWRMTDLCSEEYKDYSLNDVKKLYPTVKQLLKSFLG